MAAAAALGIQDGQQDGVEMLIVAPLEVFIEGTGLRLAPLGILCQPEGFQFGLAGHSHAAAQQDHGGQGSSHHSEEQGQQPPHPGAGFGFQRLLAGSGQPHLVFVLQLVYPGHRLRGFSGRHAVGQCQQ